MSDKSEKHECVLCNTRLESKEALKEHFRKHANKEIDSKGRKLDKNGEYVEPVVKKDRGYVKGSASKLVNGEILCDVCGERFRCNTMAIQHKFRKHPESAAKHFCPQCGMQFPLKIHRDNHLQEHTQHVPRNPYPCNECGVVFYNRTAHEYHSSTTHEKIISLYKPIVTPPPSKKIRMNNAGEPQSVYYCHICGFEYIVKFNLQKHLERLHTAQERDNPPQDLIKCKTCDALFYSEKAYSNHNMYHKPDDLYVTSEQQRLQTVTRVDQDFDIRRVQTGVEKYIPVYRRRRKSSVQVKKEKPKEDSSSDEMSPASAIESSDSDSDTGKPDSKKIKGANTSKKSIEKVEQEPSSDEMSPTSVTELSDLESDADKLYSKRIEKDNKKTDTSVS